MIGKIKYRMNSMRRKDSNTARPDRRSRTESLAEDRDEGSYDFDAPKRRRDSSRMEERGESPAYRRKKEKSGPQGWDGITAFHKKKEASGMEEWDESPAYRRKKEGGRDGSAFRGKKEKSGTEDGNGISAYSRRKGTSGTEGRDGVSAYSRRKDTSRPKEWDESPAYRRKKEGGRNGVSAFHRKKEASGYQNAGSGADEREDFPVRKKKAGAVWPGRREPSYAEAAPVHAPESEKKAAVQAEEPDLVQEEDAALPKIEGRNAVLEAFRSGKTIDKLYVLDGCKDGPVQTILREAKKQDTVIYFENKERLNQLSETKKHQGVIAVTAAYEYASVEDILARAQEKGEPPFLILLDSIEDPHNLGAIIRTANLAGVHGIIIPKRRAAGLTGTVAKASAGAVNYTPVAKVTNLSQTIKELKKQGIWFACADMEGELMYKQNLTGPIGLVIGSEGGGVSRLVKENCDYTAAVPMKGEIGSLNASAAAAVLAYEIVRQRMS